MSDEYKGSGLVALKMEMESAPRTPRPEVSGPPAAPPTRLRGDDVLDESKKLTSLGIDENSIIKRFMQSKQLVETQGQADPEYQKAVMTKFTGRQGEDLASAIMDEADNLKIKWHTENNPMFNAGGAAATAFFKDATFGQLTRIMGLAGEVIQGRPASEVMDEKAEEFRLLQKAFPKSDLAGQVAAFTIPGSPAAKVFGKAAQLANKSMAMTPLIKKLIANPNLLTKAAQSGVAAGAGTGAFEGIKQTLGEGNQEFDFDRGASSAWAAAKKAGTIAGAIPIVARGIGATATALTPTFVNNALGKVAQSMTNVQEQALRLYAKTPLGVRGQAGKQGEIGKDLYTFLTHFDDEGKIPESSQARELLPFIEGAKLSGRNIVNYFKAFKPSSNPKLDGEAKLLNEWGARFEQKWGDKIDDLSPSQVREAIDDLHSAVKNEGGWGNVGKSSDGFGNALRNAGHTLRATLDLEMGRLAKAGSKEAEFYTGLMQAAASKAKILSRVMSGLPKTEEKMEKAVEGYVSNLFTPNKSIQQGRLEMLDKAWGTNFLERSQLANAAKNVGPEGVPALFNRHATGRSGVAALIGGGLGTALGPVGTAAGTALGAASTSPKLWAGTLGTADKITGAIQGLLADPKTLPAIRALGKTDKVVKMLAGEIENALIKDGPKSAASTIRVIADTPYFVGLVDALDRVAQSREKKNLGVAIEKMGSQQDLANKP